MQHWTQIMVRLRKECVRVIASASASPARTVSWLAVTDMTAESAESWKIFQCTANDSFRVTRLDMFSKKKLVVTLFQRIFTQNSDYTDNSGCVLNFYTKKITTWKVILCSIRSFVLLLQIFDKQTDKIIFTKFRWIIARKAVIIKYVRLIYQFW